MSAKIHSRLNEDTADMKCNIDVAKSAVAKFNTNVENGPFNRLNLKSKLNFHIFINCVQ